MPDSTAQPAGLTTRRIRFAGGPPPSGVAMAPPRHVAVIDIGATSIRMAIAAITRPAGVPQATAEIRTLETLLQPVELGRDAFESRRLGRTGIERAASILRRFRRVLREYSIERPEDIRVVATSAVREATNRLAFIDRMFIATGLDVEPIDEAEVNRITYMGIAPQLLARRETAQSRALVIEVGGGDTEVLVIRDGNVLHSDSFRLGSLRLLQTLSARGLGSASRRDKRFRQLIDAHLRRILGRVGPQLTDDPDGGAVDKHLNLVAIGGDMRFAAHRMVDDWDERGLVKLRADALIEFNRQIQSMSEDEIVQRYGATFVEAETMVPAVLVYTMLVQHFELKHLFVSGTNLRDGLLADMAQGGSWTTAFRQQIVRSAMALARRCDVDETHARAVAELSRQLFVQLQDEHELDGRYEVLLYVAALLHEIGLFINVHSNHKHAMYLIRHSDIFGLSGTDLLSVGLIVRYHRRASPLPSHEGYALLTRTERVAVSKLASILRLAIAMDDTRSGRITSVSCTRENKRMVITAKGIGDVTLEQLAVRTAGELFEEIFGMPVLLRGGG